MAHKTGPLPQEKDMQERRKLKRRYLMFYSRIFDRKTGKLLGYLSDITPEGAMIISDEPVSTGEGFKLRMDLPEDVFGTRNLDFEANCVWCKPDYDPNFYMAGFQLVGIKPAETEIIERIIREYGFRDR